MTNAAAAPETATSFKNRIAKAAASGDSKTLHAALAEAQAAYAAIEKTKQGARPNQKYAPLDAVLAMAREALCKRGFSITQPTYIEDGAVFVRTLLTYAPTGEFIDSIYPVAPMGMPHMQMGGALTYARRYALLSLLGAHPEDEDNDGSDAAPAGRFQQRQEPSRSGSVSARTDTRIENAPTIRASASGFIERSREQIKSALDLASAESFFDEIKTKPGWQQLNGAERMAIIETLNDARRALGMPGDDDGGDDSDRYDYEGR